MSTAEFVATPQPGSWLGREPEASFRLHMAREAQRVWAQVPLAERAERLSRVADGLMERLDAIVAVIADENGKPPIEAIGHEVGASAGVVRWLCATGVQALVERPANVAFLPHRRTSIERVPFGVCLVISPWNFPLSIPLGQVVAGLLAGNAVVLKPSEVTPRCGALIADLLAPCKLPPNLFQVVQGDGAVGAALIEARPDKVFFTGSLATGQKVMAAASRFPIPVSLELGGVDALIVLDDADLEFAASAAAWGSNFNTGQACASVERILVDERVADAFVGLLLPKLGQIDPVRDLGRATMARQGAVWDRHVADARKRGLRVRCGGEWVAPGVYAPTLIDGPGVEASDVWREETFGPIVAIATFRGDDEAVRKHDDTVFGLTASVFSGDPARGERVARRLDAGLVAVNDVAATLHAFGEVPWGGKGASGFGRSHGEEGLLEFTRARVIDAPRGGPDVKRPWWFPYGPDQTDLIADFARAVGERAAGDRLRAGARMTSTLLRLLRRAPRL